MTAAAAPCDDWPAASADQLLLPTTAMQKLGGRKYFQVNVPFRDPEGREPNPYMDIMYQQRCDTAAGPELARMWKLCKGWLNRWAGGHGAVPDAGGGSGMHPVLGVARGTPATCRAAAWASSP